MSDPFTTEASASVAALGEVALIGRIREWLGGTGGDALARQDDCAVLPRESRQQLATVDSLIYGRHFDDHARPEDAGAKLVNRNLSDIAAMAGTPTYGLLAFFLPSNLRTDWLADFCRGMREAAEAHGLGIAGGDIAEAREGQFQAALTVLGYAARPLQRAAAAGDTLFVTGRLGGSLRGRHLRFVPRLNEARWLAERGARAMIDLSDGLAKDLPAMLGNYLAARLDLTLLPVSADAEALAQESGLSALAHAFCDGEDHELLMAVPDPAASLEADFAHAFGVELTRIGTVEEAAKAPGRVYDAATGKAIEWTQGYEHLRAN